MSKNITSIYSLAQNSPLPTPEIGIFPARVIFILLNDKSQPTIFKEYGEWNSLGSIFFSILNNPNPSKDITSNSIAKPLFPNIKNYPLINEIVYIIALPSSNIQGDVNDLTYYYFQPINIWNSPHHNAIPDPINQNSIPKSQKRDYQQTSLGAVRRINDGGTEIDLGETFQEKTEIRSIQPFEGDIIYEGRWGQSIRFGSTVKGSNIINPWSNNSNDGDPITIIRNNQYKEDKEPWIPQIEDINKEGSSIYLTSNQILPIEVSSKDYQSYKTPPPSPNKFQGEQIIINSGRLLFNSKQDSILLSSKKTINLNSVESVNIDSPEVILNSKKVLLGSNKADESLILGDKFFKDFKQLLNSIISLSNSLSTPIGTPVPFIPNIFIPGPATKLSVQAQRMLSKLENYKSKISKTK
jgi:hypothetical protein